MILKYKNKTYNSEDLPFFLFFKNTKGRKEFITFINNYKQFDKFIEIDCIHSILAGNTIIKDKRSILNICIESKEEKQFLQKYLFSDMIEESNAILISPEDIDKTHLQKWVDKYIDKLT